ncbi:MAG: hypothetical protein Q7R70_01155 [Candidatus Diapherotrites archaeon]|nr:hypothetical protein [Candidatus Diapherotrites archaeon]
MPREPPKRPERPGRGFPEEDPMSVRRKVVERAAKQREIAKEKGAQELLKKSRLRHCQAGGFIDLNPRTEKGIFLRLFVKGKKGKLQRVVVQPGVQKFKFLEDTVHNLKRELSHYGRVLNSENSEITLYGQRNMMSFVQKGPKLGVVKIIVEAFPFFKFTEATSLFFDRKGDLIIEHIQSPWEEPKK